MLPPYGDNIRTGIKCTNLMNEPPGYIKVVVVTFRNKLAPRSLQAGVKTVGNTTPLIVKKQNSWVVKGINNPLKAIC